MNEEYDNSLEISKGAFETDFDDIDYEPHVIDDSDSDYGEEIGYFD